MKSTIRFTEIPAPACPMNPVARDLRFPNFVGAPAGSSERLDQLHVTVVGAGAVGGSAALQLARMRVGTIRLIDPKAYKAESILTQPVFPDAIGQAKAHHMARLCKEISPETRVFACQGSIGDLDLSDLAPVDAILLATDNLAAEVATGQMAMRTETPLFQGAVHGETLVAQVRCFENRDGSGPCPACGFNDAEWNQLARHVTFACDPGAALDPVAGAAAGTPPTISTPGLCSLAASFTVIALLKHVIGFGQPVADTLFEYCGHTGRTFTTPLKRRPECQCDHTRWTFATLEAAPGDLSLADLADRSAPSGAPDDTPLFDLDGCDWLDAVACACGHHAPLGRFVPRAEPGPDRCDACGGELSRPPLARRESVSATSLGPALHVPLRELGVTATRNVRVRTATSTTSIRCNPPSAA